MPKLTVWVKAVIRACTGSPARFAQPLGDTGTVTAVGLWREHPQVSLLQGTRVSQGGEEELGPVALIALVHVSSPFQGPDGRA